MPEVDFGAWNAATNRAGKNPVRAGLLMVWQTGNGEADVRGDEEADVR